MQGVPFYQSNLFGVILSSLVTFAVGLFAYRIYQKQRKDAKQDAATSVVLELKKAEEHLKDAKESIIKDELIKEDVFLMPTTQWERHKHLFSRNLKPEDITELDSFYEKCQLYDEVVKYNNSFFVKNEEHIRSNLQAALADYTKSYLVEFSNATTQNQKDDAKRLYKLLIEAFAAQFMEEVTSPTSQYFYRPIKTMKDASAIMHTINMNITSTQGYIKLQTLSSKR